MKKNAKIKQKLESCSVEDAIVITIGKFFLRISEKKNGAGM